MNANMIPDSTGRLTSRQREFLDSLESLYARRGQAVSYEDVAKDMKVSKWTAYDILHGLCQRGFLSLEHEVTSGKGRSRILYTPAAKSLPTARAVASGTEAGLRTVSRLRRKVLQYARYSITDAIHLSVQRIVGEENPYRVVLYTCVMVVLFARVFRLDVERLVHIREFVASSLAAGTILSLLSEVMFSLMRDEKWLLENLGLSQEAVGQFAECERRFQESLVQLSDKEKQLVVSVIRQTVTP